MKILLKIALIIISIPGLAQYRNDMPEVIQADQNNSRNSTEKYTNNRSLQATSTTITNKYKQVGSPKILILLGRQLGSGLSQWQADSRETITTMNRAYQGNNQSKDTRDTYRMSEKRQLITTITTPGMQNFYKGFSQYMQSVGLGSISYDSILRKTQRKNELSGLVDRSTDKREVEADAIIENVDILVEILDAGSETVLGETVDKIQVKVTRMDTYETVAQHTGMGQEYYTIKESWGTNSDGYEKVKSVIFHHADVGYQKASELLSLALNQPFKERSENFNNANSQPKPRIKKKKRVLPPNQ